MCLFSQSLVVLIFTAILFLCSHSPHSPHSPPLSISLQYLSSSNPPLALSWLTKASKLTTSLSSLPSQTLTTTTTTTTTHAPGADPTKGPVTLLGLKILTLNNLACYYKSVNDLSQSFALLRTAVESSGKATEEGDDESVGLVTIQQRAVTHSNLSAVLSGMGKHEGARKHAKLAVGYCKRDLKRHSEHDGEHGPFDGEHDPNGDDSHPAAINKTVSALAVACYNLAVETEFCRGVAEAIGWYKRAAELVNVVTGADQDTHYAPEGMKNKIVKSYMEAKRKRGQEAGKAATRAPTIKTKRGAGGGINAIRTMKMSQTAPAFNPDDAHNPNPNEYDKVRARVLSKTNDPNPVKATPTLSSSNAHLNNDSVLVGEEIEGDTDALLLDDDLDDGVEDDLSPDLNPLNVSADSPPHKTPTNNAYRPRSAGDARFEPSRAAAGRDKETKIARPRTATVAGRAPKAAISTSVPTTPTKKPPQPQPPVASAPQDRKMPERSVKELKEHIDMMDQLAKEARQKIKEMDEYRKTPSTSVSRRPKSAAAATTTTTTATAPPSPSKPPVQGPTFTPLDPTEWLHGAKERNDANVRKLIEQRDATQKIVAAKEKELKNLKLVVEKQAREFKERDGFNVKVIEEFR